MLNPSRRSHYVRNSGGPFCPTDVYRILTPRLDRDGVRSKLIPEEADKRRTLFWDLVGAEARLVSTALPESLRLSVMEP